MLFTASRRRRIEIVSPLGVAFMSTTYSRRSRGGALGGGWMQYPEGLPMPNRLGRLEQVRGRPTTASPSRHSLIPTSAFECMQTDREVAERAG